jgi:superfamily I DNA/RNA helicase
MLIHLGALHSAPTPGLVMRYTHFTTMDSRLAILPTARKVEEELKRLSRGGCVMGHRLMTFPQLVDALWSEAGSPLRLIDPISEQVAIGEAIRRASASGIVIAQSRGLAGCLRGLIRQLKSAALMPADLQEAAAAIPSAFRPQVAMAAAVFAAYEELLRENALADPHDRERLVLAALHEAERSGHRPRPLRGVKHLLVAEIYDLSLLQFLIVASLIRLIGDADLTIQAAPHKVDSRSFASLTWNRFVGEESIADKVLPHFVHRGGRDGQLGFVLEHLFTGAAPAPPPFDGTITIVEAPDCLREVEEAARMIRRMFEANAKAGTPPPRLERIGIIARDFTPYAGYLESVFRRYRIPLRIANARNLRATAPARVLLSLLKLPAQGYRREDLVAICKSPYLQTRKTPDADRLMAEAGYIDHAAGSLADRFAVARNAALAEAIAASDSVLRDRANRRAGRFDRCAQDFARMIALFDPLTRPATLAAHAASLDHLLAELRFNPTADEADELDEFGIATALRETLDAITRAGKTISAACEFSPVEFAELLEDALAARILDSDLETSGAVQAMPVLDARGLDFDCVFILGLNDGVFPRYHADDPLIPDDLRPFLNRAFSASLRRRFGTNAADAPGPLLCTRYHHNAEDWFLFFLALSMPEHRALLSYAATDERGSPLTRSPFIDEVMTLCHGDAAAHGMLRRITGAQFIPAVDDSFARAEFVNAAALAGLLDDSCAEVAAPRAELDGILRRARIEDHRDDYLSRPSREETADNLPDPGKLALANHFDGRVSTSDRLRAFLLHRDGAPRRWSASQFDELAACGFKFFAGRVLGLRSDDDPDYEQSPLETGSLVHRFLHDLIGLRPDFKDRPSAMALAHQLLAASRQREESTSRDAALFRLEWARLERIVAEFIEYECSRVNDAASSANIEIMPEYQINFTLSGARPMDEDGRLALAIDGRIDRLDLHRDHNSRITVLRVIDYKTSRKSDNYKDHLKLDNFGVFNFQLPLYVLGALDAFVGELAPEVAIEAGYVVLRSREKEVSETFSRDLFVINPRRHPASAGAQPPVASRLLDLAATAIGGQFDVDPLRCDEYCSFRRVCRFNKAAG